MTDTLTPTAPGSDLPDGEPDERPTKRHTRSSRSLLDPDVALPALRASVRKLDPRDLARNPVMFVVEVGAALTTVLFLVHLDDSDRQTNVFSGLVVAFLWFTVLFATFAEAMAEGRGKAQAASLRRTRQETVARRRRSDGTFEEVASTALSVGDDVEVVAGEVIPGDGDVVEGIASVDESASRLR